jgi:origin recognition complex subunit 5
MVVGRYELPYYSKFLLVSAFLASYNPTTTDARIFSRDSGLKRKNRRPGQKSNRGIAKVLHHNTRRRLTE